MLTNKPKESRLSDWFMRGLLPGASPGEELQTKHVPHSASHHHLKKQETDTWRVFPLILFPQIIESNAKWEKAKEGENFQQKKKLYALAFGKVRWVTSVRERWANLEAAVPIQTTILASFHCQHLRLESDFSTLCSQFLFPPFFPPTWFVLVQDRCLSFIAYTGRTHKWFSERTNPGTDAHPDARARC